MNMKFYMTPGSCSTGIHILLEEAGLVFEAHLVNLMAGDQNKPDYLAINPKGTIPTLMLDDGTALSSFLTIAWWLGRNHPRRKLLPESLAGELQVLEVMNYAVNTIHAEGFTRIFTTDKYSDNEDEHEAIQVQGRTIVETGFSYIESLLCDSSYVTEHFTIADAALFYVEFWADRTGIPLPQKCQAHYLKLLQRPTVQQVLLEEGYTSVVQQARIDS